MSYKKLRHLIAALAAVSSLAAQAHPANSGSDTKATAVSASTPGAALSARATLTSLAPVSVGDTSADAQGTNVKLAAVSPSTELLGAVKAQKGNLRIQQTEINGWMLILIGAFLIWTMSQRRIRSILD